MRGEKTKGTNHIDTVIAENQQTWDAVADLFVDAAALPVWGPFSVGDDLNLLPEIKDKTFLEIACGSGRSIKYLVDNGVKKVYGLDLSQVQIDEATNYNKKAIENGIVELVQSPMEAKLQIEPVDVVFSVYGLGWTPEPEKTLSNIYSYLKPDGLFVWSWDHSIFSDILYKDGNFSAVYSYHEENPITIQGWKKRNGVNAHLTYRKVSTWFKLLTDAGFEVVGYYEPAPKTIERGSEDPEKYYSIQKAKLIPATFIFVCKKK